MVNCKRVEEWIPLYVEGDLRESQANDLRAHAQTCEACGALMAQYEQSQAWLRVNATPTFDESFVDTIRAGVMREISAINLRRPFVERVREWIAPRRFALVTAALMLIFIALAAFVYLSRSRSNHQVAVTAKLMPAPPVEKKVEGTPTPTAVSGDQNPQPKRRTPRRAVPMLAGHSRRIAPRIETTPGNALAQTQPAALPAAPIDSSNATPKEEKLRIEIQTADPTIRIIWFAPKPAETDAP
ncbi:MAG: anti-sigma factor family protein [Blastocatellia bacterium]